MLKNQTRSNGAQRRQGLFGSFCLLRSENNSLPCVSHVRQDIARASLRFRSALASQGHEVYSTPALSYLQPQILRVANRSAIAFLLVLAKIAGESEM